MTVDWSKLKLPEPRRNRPECSTLAPFDYWRLFVLARLNRQSIAQIIHTAVISYLERQFAEVETRLTVEANTEGKTPEELIQSIVDSETKS